MPSDKYMKRVETANKCATLYAQENRSDRFAFARAYSRVINGLFSEGDFKEQDYNPAL